MPTLHAQAVKCTHILEKMEGAGGGGGSILLVLLQKNYKNK